MKYGYDTSFGFCGFTATVDCSKSKDCSLPAVNYETHDINFFGKLFGAKCNVDLKLEYGGVEEDKSCCDGRKPFLLLKYIVTYQYPSKKEDLRMQGDKRLSCGA